MLPFTTESHQIGHLEAELWIPEHYELAAIVCHPHSLHGGSMQNKVVTQTARVLLAKGCLVARFNFRGVGKSSGTFDHGVGEVDDLSTIHQWLNQKYSTSGLILAGFSFGSYVCYRYASVALPQALICIAPPVVNFNFAELPEPACPWSVLQGEADEVVAPECVYQFVDRAAHSPRLVRFPETSHFFHGKLSQLRSALEEVLAVLVG